MRKKKLTQAITLKVAEDLYEGYTREFTEAEREEYRAECRWKLALKIHGKRFKPEDWDLEE